ncbi:hypothetical protein Meth11DRAFT_0998 [Methylophilaceae bacterium 11]|uniref:DUF2065 domain-containing protein n=1 Tax=Methylotenera sp. 1P/1 TaxID=1131551 RepID=UPI0003777290|nr:DUF2065 domain-containing protein [Methylotenera sp. 1P/1]EUJ10185.1 hypothetical protein Meth11DRAFT_0998 [Methylophilaceae bacterium 11]
MKDSLLTALGLVLIIEGLLPLLMPQAWRDTFQRLIVLKDGQLRFIGLISVLGGFLLTMFSR